MSRAKVEFTTGPPSASLAKLIAARGKAPPFDLMEVDEPSAVRCRQLRHRHQPRGPRDAHRRVLLHEVNRQVEVVNRHNAPMSARPAAKLPEKPEGGHGSFLVEREQVDVLAIPPPSCMSPPFLARLQRIGMKSVTINYPHRLSARSLGPDVTRGIRVADDLIPRPHRPIGAGKKQLGVADDMAARRTHRCT